MVLLARIHPQRTELPAEVRLMARQPARQGPPAFHSFPARLPGRNGDMASPRAVHPPPGGIS